MKNRALAFRIQCLLGTGFSANYARLLKSIFIFWTSVDKGNAKLASERIFSYNNLENTGKGATYP